MLSKEQLIVRIETIFDKEKKDQRNNNFQPEIYLGIHHGPKTMSRALPEGEINKDVPNTYLIYENLELLIKLYLKISSNKELKKSFICKVLTYFELYNTIICGFNKKTVADLAFYFLFKIRRLDLAEKVVVSGTNNTLDDIYKTIQRLLIYEHYLMTEEDLKIIKRIINAILIFKPKNVGRFEYSRQIDMKRFMEDLINDLDVYRLKKELSDDFNYQINQDKEKVQKLILDYGFDSNAAKALSEIDESYYDYSEENFNLRNNISLLKEIFDNITDSVLEKLKLITDKKPVKKNDKEGPTERKHRFICEELLFTEGEKKTMSSINKMLNEEKHSLISKKEKFRITRNFTIEFLLLLFSKLNQLDTL